jgi:hypothetical protein
MIQVTGNLNLNNRQRDCLREIQMLLLYPDVIMYIQVANLPVASWQLLAISNLNRGFQVPS